MMSRYGVYGVGFQVMPTCRYLRAAWWPPNTMPKLVPPP